MTPKADVEINNAFHVKKIREGVLEIGVHVADVTHFVKSNSLVDREAKKRGTAVELVNRYVPMLPQRLGGDIVSLKAGEDRFTFSVIFNVEEVSGKMDGDPWVGKTIVRNGCNLVYENVDAVLGNDDSEVEDYIKEALRALLVRAPLLVSYLCGLYFDLPIARNEEIA